MFTVTITNHGSSQYRIEANGVRCRYASRSDPGVAAAEAIRMSGGSKDGHYVILGPSDVMSIIPKSVQSK